MNVHFLSEKQDWETPGSIFDPLDKEFFFTLDVCASAENSKVAQYFSAEDDGLSQPWYTDICWMNPPYGREIGK